MPQSNGIVAEKALASIYRITTKTKRVKFYFYMATSPELARKFFLRVYPEREKHIIAVEEFNQL